MVYFLVPTVPGNGIGHKRAYFLVPENRIWQKRVHLYVPRTECSMKLVNGLFPGTETGCSQEQKRVYFLVPTVPGNKIGHKRVYFLVPENRI